MILIGTKRESEREYVKKIQNNGGDTPFKSWSR
jgi:hypothetical protein